MTTTGEKALTEAKVKKLFSVVTDLKDLALFQIAIAGGLRRKDIIGIKKDNIDYKNNSITFYEHKKRRLLTVFLPLNVMNTLAMLAKSDKKSPYLFGSGSKTGHIASKTAYNILQKYLLIAGIESIPFHALRSTCIKLCERRGWTAEQTAKHTGDTVRVIQEHYLTPSVEEMKEVAQDKAIL